MKTMNDDLLVKYLLKETSPEEDVYVREWLRMSSDNEEYLAQFQKIWDTSKRLASETPIDENEAWLRFKEKTKLSKAPFPPVKQIYHSWLRVAAVFLVAAAGAWSVYSYLSGNNYTTVAATQEVRTRILPDGSEVTLNKNSTLSYQDNFEGDKRLVRLENGEAFFKVTHDQSKPFEIEASNVTVLVVGTSFNVKHVDESTEIIVESGIVKVSKGRESIELRKNEKVNIGADQNILQKEISTDQLYNYYRSKEFVADETPLWRVVEVLNKAYNANIIIGNPAIRDLSLSATFREESLDNILDVISKTFDIKVVKAPDQIILK